MKPLLNAPLTALSLRRAALALDIGRQRAAFREDAAALRDQFAWLGLAAMAGQSLRNRGWARVLTLGALAVAMLRRMRASSAD